MGSGVGFAACAVSSLGFGTFFIPVKRFNAGDGIFFQWTQCIAIWIVGLIVQAHQDQPRFEPYAMLGGMLWTLGNTLCIPIIHLIGLGLGTLIWGGMNLFMGWASGKFGLMGTKKETSIELPALNIIGVVVALLSLSIYFFVKTDLKHAKDVEVGSHGGAVYEPLPDITESSNVQEAPESQGVFALLDKLSPIQRQILGFAFALTSGVFFGINFNPPQHLIDHPYNSKGEQVHSKEFLDYVFSHFSGILLTGTIIMLLYSAAMKNKPFVNNQIILPGFVSGIIWAIAQVSWFVANDNLEFVITFPIIATGPGVVASLIGVIFFKEVKGKKNLTILAFAFFSTLLGITLIVLSKVGV